MMKCSIEGRGCQVGREQLGREWKNGRGVLSLSESLSLFFPLPPLPPRRQAHKKKITYPCPPHEHVFHSKTRPRHGLSSLCTR
jgi:hypothetical protein